MKKVLVALMGLALVAGSSTSVRAADLPDEQWSIMENLFEKAYENTGVTLLGLSIQDNSNLSEQVSSLVGSTDGSELELSRRLCKSMDDEFCAPGKAKYLTAFLPVCKSDSETNCIEGVSAVKEGIQIKGQYSRNFPDKGYTDFPGAPELNVPSGSTPSLWNFPGLVHGGGSSQYLASFVVQAGFGSQSKALINSYTATINPVSIKAGRYGRNEAKDAAGKSLPSCAGHCGMELIGHSTDDKFVCASLDEGFCAVRESFPSEVRFKISARLSQSPAGWFHGRLKSPDVVIKPFGTGVSVSIEAEPVSVPVVGLLEPVAKLPTSLVDSYLNTPAFSWGNSGKFDVRTSNRMLMISPDSQEAFNALEVWKDLIKDKANASPTQWAIRTLNAGAEATQCFKSTSELVGIVTTNSMVYLGSPPIFDKGSQTLDYKVASPHLTSKGEVFKGTYDLQLKSDVARCLYGFSNAPISAKISIVSESGQSNVATTIVNEKDGWMRMAAYGFTFSSPTVQVKLTQEVPTKVTDVQKAPVKKITITCTKGISKKKITAANPKCPTGYKKKG